MQVLRTSCGVIHFRAANLDSPKKTLVFINSLGTDFRIWDGVVAALGGEFNIVLHDKCGHGLSTYAKRPSTIAGYAADLESLLLHLGVSKAVVVGLSVGGLIAQELFQTRPDMIAGLVLSNTALKIGTLDSWGARIAAIRENGIESIADAILERWFSPQFRASRKDELEIYRNMLVRTPQEGYLACCEAIRDADYTSEASNISAPVLCIGGEHDGSTPPAQVQDMASRIPDARFELIEGVAHLPCIEQPEIHAKLIVAFARSL